MKALTALIFIAASVGLFFWYIEPAWATAGQTQTQLGQYSDDIAAAKTAQAKLNQLTTTYNAFSTGQIAQLNQFMPSGVDPIKFVLALNSIAAQYGSGLASVALGTPGPIIGQNYDTLPVTFTVNMTYPNFLSFLSDMEHSLPPTDVTNLSFVSPDTSSVYTFTVSVQTYYLQ